MTELSRDAKSLIALSRRGVDPSAADRERVRAKLAPAWSSQQRALEAGGFQVRRGKWMIRYGVWISLAWLQPGVPAARVPEPAAAVSGEMAVVGSAREAGGSARSEPEAIALAAIGGSRHGAITSAPNARRSATESSEDRCARWAAELRAASGAASTDLRAMRARLAAECQPAGNGDHTRAHAKPASGCDVVGSSARPECKHVEAMACDASGTGAGCKRAPPCGSAGCERASACTSADCAHRATDAASARARSARSSAADSGETPASEARDASLSTTSQLHVRRSAPEQGGPSVELQPIDDELELLSSAQDALRRGQPSQALRLVQQHAFRFPRGALAQERSVVQALALCALDRRSAARVIIDDMKQRAPSSPLLSSVRRACGL